MHTGHPDLGCPGRDEASFSSEAGRIAEAARGSGLRNVLVRVARASTSARSASYTPKSAADGRWDRALARRSVEL
jgi:hypothetical protein